MKTPQVGEVWTAGSRKTRTAKILAVVTTEGGQHVVYSTSFQPSRPHMAPLHSFIMFYEPPLEEVDRLMIAVTANFLSPARYRSTADAGSLVLMSDGTVKWEPTP